MPPKTEAVQLTLETLEFLSELVGMVSVSAGSPDFEEAAARVAKARRELAAQIAERNHIFTATSGKGAGK